MATRDETYSSRLDDASDSDDEFFDALASENVAVDGPEEPEEDTSENGVEDKEKHGDGDFKECQANLAGEVDTGTSVLNQESSNVSVSDGNGNERTLCEGIPPLTDARRTVAAVNTGQDVIAGLQSEEKELGGTARVSESGDCNEDVQSQEALQTMSSTSNATEDDATHEGLETEEKEPEMPDDGADLEIERKLEEERLRREREDAMTEEEREILRDKSQDQKGIGNDLFKKDEFLDAISAYSEALEICPLCYKKERSIMHANRAACRIRHKQYEEAIADCNKALELHPHYMKVWLRRANTYELMEKFDEALADFQQVLELDPGCYEARAACMRLPDQIKERNEKLKEEMFGKLKDLGNMVLRPFGLSTSNFQFQQDPNTGSYSVNFNQAPASGNGK